MTSRCCLRSESFAVSGEPASMVSVGGKPIMRFKDEVAEAFKQHIRSKQANRIREKHVHQLLRSLTMLTISWWLEHRADDKVSALYLLWCLLEACHSMRYKSLRCIACMVPLHDCSTLTHLQPCSLCICHTCKSSNGQSRQPSITTPGVLTLKASCPDSITLPAS